jgi:rSAM/selenodomain-associated transferase 1
MSQKLIIFVRAPRLGEVKTRLAHAIGKEAALRAYRVLLGQLLENLESLQNVELRFTPDAGRAELAPWLRPGWALMPQGEGDLGERLGRAFQESFAEGCQRVVIIGSDCPAVSVTDIESAWRALLTNDVVLGPASDGGYWLIGLRGPQAGLLENVPWSTASVLETTLARVRNAGLTFHCLRELTDIDTAEDWKKLNRTIPRDT